MLLLIVSFLIFIVIALELNRFFQYRKLFDWGLGLFLIFFSLVVFVMTTSGLVYQMNNPWFVIGFECVVLLLSLAITRFWRKPHNPVLPFKFPSFTFKLFSLPLPIMIFLVITIGVAVLNLVYVLLVPPNNNDSLAIHLARIGMWDQFGSWLPWNTAVIWQLTFPFNAEIISYWTLLFTRGEHLLGLITYLTGYLSILVIYQLAKEVSSKKGIALLAAFTWAAFPVVQLNFTSTRHDHPSSLLLLTAIFYFYHHIKQKNPGYLVLAGLAIGLSIGTNYSVGGYLLGLALFFLLYWFCFRQINLKEILTLAAAAAFTFFLFSSPVYVSNYIHFGSLLGPDAPESGSVLLNYPIKDDTSSLDHIGLMAGRWVYQIVDF